MTACVPTFNFGKETKSLDLPFKMVTSDVKTAIFPLLLCPDIAQQLRNIRRGRDCPGTKVYFFITMQGIFPSREQDHHKLPILIASFSVGPIYVEEILEQHPRYSETMNSNSEMAPFKTHYCGIFRARNKALGRIRIGGMDVSVVDSLAKCILLSLNSHTYTAECKVMCPFVLSILSSTRTIISSKLHTPQIISEKSQPFPTFPGVSVVSLPVDQLKFQSTVTTPTSRPAKFSKTAGLTSI